MAEFTVHIPDSFVARVVTPVEDRIQAIQGDSVVVDKILPWLGVATVDDLTPKQKAEVVCQYYLWSMVATLHASEEMSLVWNTAWQDTADDFDPGT